MGSEAELPTYITIADCARYLSGELAKGDGEVLHKVFHVAERLNCQ